MVGHAIAAEARPVDVAPNPVDASRALAELGFLCDPDLPTGTTTRRR